MVSEMQSLKYNNLDKFPKNQNLFDCKWMYKLKDNPSDDKRTIFETRCMTTNFTQQIDVNHKIFDLLSFTYFNNINSNFIEIIHNKILYVASNLIEILT